MKEVTEGKVLEMVSVRNMTKHRRKEEGRI